MMLHPRSADYAIVRWTAPASATYSISAYWRSVDPNGGNGSTGDIVVNGVELGGGSIRIHQRALQERVLTLMKYPPEDQVARFGHMLEAFTYGAPPHGGIATGIDRIAMLLADAGNIREVMAFPKTQKAICLMTEAPSRVTPAQLKELSIKLDVVE